MAQASELATSVTTNMSASDLQAVGTQMSALVSQLTSIVNQQSAGGNYLFGGTANQPPITAAGAYNTATNGVETSIDVQPGNPVQTSIVAGQAGTPGVSGFLYDASTGVDVLGAIKQAAADLNAGNGDSDTSNSICRRPDITRRWC